MNVLICAATRWEALPLRAALTNGARLVRTGMGSQAATAALSSMEHDGLVISAGSAGGLQEGLRLGDVVAQELTPCPAAASALRRLRPEVRFGAIAHSDRVLSDPREKAELGRRTGALAVDMESAAIAAWCRERGLPALALRVILDEVAMPLPAGLPEQEGALALTRHLALHPFALPGLARLGLRHRRAMRSLTAIIPALLEAI